MERVQKIGSFAAALAAILMSVPQFAQAREPVHGQATVVRDVALEAGGKLSGQVLDSSGIPQRQVAVRIQSNGQLPQQINTDANGWFEFSGLAGGVYQVSTGDSVSVFRAWAPNTAPPSATTNALVVTDESVVRGAHGHGHHHHRWAPLSQQSTYLGSDCRTRNRITALDQRELNDDRCKA